MASEISALPSRFGRYEILGLIGSGAFADVVRAWDEGLASHVAIKVLTTDAAADELARERFLEEGQLLRRVRSPNVLAVHDIGELDDGRPYLVIDLADGGTLEDRIEPLEGQPIDAGTIRRVIDALATGMEDLHAAGVIHRDLKPENLMIATGAELSVPVSEVTTVVGGDVFTEEERLLIGDLGLAKDVANRGPTPSVIGGSARYQAPEQLRADGIVGPATDLYAASAILWQLLSGSLAPEPHDVSDGLRIFRSGWQQLLARAMALDPADRYPSATAWRSAVLDQLEVEPLALGDGGPATPTLRCPYKGLASFQPTDAEVFFGRERLVEELVQRLQTNRVLIVAGPSGSGKSSAVRAGLLPALRDGALAGSENWHYELFTPGAHPMEELHYRLTRSIEGNPRLTATELAAEPRAARRLFDDARASEAETDGDRGWLLYIDQFEEVFTQPDDPDAARDFVEALSSMVDPTDSHLRVVLAVRADFYGRCAQLAWLAQRITENQVLVGPMNREDMRRAIEEPARRHGLRLEPGLVDAVLDEGDRSAGSLPLISHALVETWTRRDGNVLNLDGFRGAGGVGGAIAQSAESLFETFDDDRQRAAKRLLLRLISPGEGTADTRRRLPIAEVERDIDPELTASVVDRFVSARLLAVDDSSVEIAHEALIGGWPRLRGWIDSEREQLRFRQRVSRAATEWDAAARDPDLLWRGTPLATAVDWASEHGEVLDRLETTFIDDAETARRTEEADRADRETRTARNRRRLTIFLAAVALVSAVGLGVTVAALRQASSSTEVAERQFANALGTTALGQVRSDPRQALLLAMESGIRVEVSTPEARAAMIQARMTMSEPGVVPFGPAISTPGSFKVALRPDGAVAAVADPNGPIRLYDVATGEQRGGDLLGHDDGARTLTYTVDGSTLISGGADGQLIRWDLSGAAEATPAPVAMGPADEANPIVWSVAVNPDNTLLAVGRDDATIQILDAASGDLREVIEWDDGSGGITVVEFSPDGAMLAASNRSGRTNGWDTATWAPLWDPLTTPEGPKRWEIAFHPDGTRFATAGDGPTAIIHDATTGRPIEGLEFEPDVSDATGGATASVRGVAFSDDGTRLIGGTGTGTIQTWDATDPTIAPTVSSSRHTDAVEHGALSVDGLVYASVGDDKRLRLWRTGSVPMTATYDGVEGGAYGAAFAPSGNRLAVADGRGGIHLVDLDGGDLTAGQPGHADGATWDVVWSPDGTWLASIGDDGRVLRWDPDNLGNPTEIGRHQHPARGLAVSPDGRHLVTSDRGDDRGDGADVFVWATAGGTLQEQLPGHANGVRAVAFSPDGRVLATADGLGDVRIWSADDFTLLTEWSIGNQVSALGFNEEGLLASSDSSEDVRVFDPETGRQVGVTVSGLGTNGGEGIGFDPEGRTLAVVTRGGSLFLVDWMDGAYLTPSPLDAHLDAGASSFELAFSTDNTRFATTDTGGTVRVWDLLSTDRACAEAAQRLDPSIEADLFDGASTVACGQP